MMAPVTVLAWEPPQAQALEWLPLAVRFKLDAAGVKIGLAQWQSLAHEERAWLLACPAGDAFEALLSALVPKARRVAWSPGSWRDYLRARAPAQGAPRQAAGAA